MVAETKNNKERMNKNALPQYHYVFQNSEDTRQFVIVTASDAELACLRAWHYHSPNLRFYGLPEALVELAQNNPVTVRFNDKVAKRITARKEYACQVCKVAIIARQPHWLIAIDGDGLNILPRPERVCLTHLMEILNL